ncbi:MAG: hypothetical protein GXY83_38580 [Rhodopirellula sp.]|nr:hypothetical protein [Rhodopirellula sp.]
MRRITRNTGAIIIALLLLGVASTAVCEGNIASCGYLQGQPKIDGNMEAGEWLGATRLSAFCSIEPNSKLANDATAAYVGISEDSIYFAFVCDQKDFTPSPAPAMADDGELWSADSVEVIIACPEKPLILYHFIGSIDGYKLDEKGEDRKWTAEWHYAAAKSEAGWTAEFRIPLSSMEGIPLDVVAMNVARNVRGANSQTSSWTRTARLTRQLGRLIMSADVPAVETQTPESREQLGMVVKIDNTTDMKQHYFVDVKAVRRADQKVVLAETNKVDFLEPAEKAVVTAIVTEKPGLYDLSCHVRHAESNQTVLRQDWAVEIPQPLNVELRKYLFHDKVQPMVYFTRSSAMPPTAAVTFRLMDGAKPVRSQTVSVAKTPAISSDPRWKPAMGKQVSCMFDLAGLEPKEYTIEVISSASGRGDDAVVAYLYFQKPAKPEWLDSDAGMEDTLPKPWTPVEVADQQVKMWGRTYTFAQNALPARIETQGKSILADPIRLACKVNGKDQDLKTVDFKIADAKETSATVVSKQTGNGLMLNTTSYVEFDGLIKIDIDVNVAQHASLDGLTLEIPIKQEFATLLQGQPDNPTRGVGMPWPSWTGHLNGLLGKNDVQGPWVDFMWLGTERVGLSWCCESPQFFSLKKPNTAIAIKNLGDRRVLQINVIDTPSKKKSFRLTFGIQATPVRPPSKPYVTGVNWYHYDFHYERTPTNVSPGFLTYPMKGNLPTDRGSISLDFDGVKEDYPVDWRHLLRLDFPTNPAIFATWNRQGKVLALVRKGPKEETLLYATDVNTLPSQLAFTWNADGYSMWIDGKVRATAKGKLFDGVTLDGGRIMVGGGAYCRGVAISSTDQPLTTTNAASANSPGVVLWDNLENIENINDVLFKTSPARCATQSGFSGGRITGFVDVHKSDDGRHRVWLSAGVENINWFEKWRKDFYWDYVMFAEYWGEFEALLRTEKYDEDLKRFITAAHDAGIKVMLHTTAVLGDVAPEVQLYGDEIWVEPKLHGWRRWAFDPQDAYYQAIVGQWQNATAHMARDLIKRYDLDGLYFDGTHYPRPDKNTWHGCGYVDDNSRLQPTHPLFEYRNWMRRIRRIGDAYKPDFRLDVHCLTNYTPTMSFADGQLTGEQYMMVADSFYGGSLRKLLTLDSFRSNFIGTQFGSQPEFHVDTRGDKLKLDNAQAVSLIHGVAVRREQWASITAAMKEFDLDVYSDRWHPYYENSVQAEPSDVKVSYCLGKDGRVLIFMANFGESTQTAKIRFPDAAGLPIGQSLRDRTNGKWAGYFTGEMELTLEPWKIKVLATE